VPYGTADQKDDECVDDGQKAEDRSEDHGAGKAGLAQSCADHVQTTQGEGGWREQSHPKRTFGIEALGLCDHEIAASHPDEHGENSEGNH